MSPSGWLLGGSLVWVIVGTGARVGGGHNQGGSGENRRGVIAMGGLVQDRHNQRGGTGAFLWGSLFWVLVQELFVGESS